MNRIVSAERLPRHRLRLRFEDGVEGVVDLSHLAGRGVFASWTDESEFAKVFIDTETGTVARPGGIDLCPDTLYIELTKESPFETVGET